MKRSLHLYLILVSLVVGAMTIGCGGGGGGSVGTGGAETQLRAVINSGGTTTAWPNAYLNGNAVQPPCDTTTDNNCLVSFSNTESNSSGYLNLKSDAIPGYWEFGGVSDQNCNTGASTGVVDVSANVNVTITCGETGSGSALVSPRACTLATGKLTTCPSTVTLTINGATLPTTRAMTVSAYTDTGSNLSTSSRTASSSTTITVATPHPSAFLNNEATVVLTVVDPNTNEVLGAGYMTISDGVVTCPKPQPGEPGTDMPCIPTS